ASDRAQSIRAAGGRLQRRRQNPVEPRRGEPSIHASTDGSRNSAGRFREIDGQGPMTMAVARRLSSLVILAAILPCGCTGHEVTADARSPKAVRLVAVESSPSAESTAYSAVITPNAQVDLVFRVAGYVVDVRRAPGADGRTRALEPGAVVTRGV